MDRNRPAPHLTRRSFLLRASLTASGLLVAGAVPSRAQGTGRARLPGDPFTLGVASGDPTDTGVVLWTRLAPDPLNGGGMPPAVFDVSWELAGDESFSRVVRRGTVQARPDTAHAVHVDVDGLPPDRWWWYRFTVGSYESPVGRTRTFPSPAVVPEAMAFAVAGCQHWEAGYFAAFANMAAEDLDVVFHTGDYIYEGAPTVPGSENEPFPRIRTHPTDEIQTLEDYRDRHALYKTDPDLQAAHARFPFIVTWDDHEVENNYAGDVPENAQQPDDAFVRRRAAAYQAYWEHMPLRADRRPSGPDMPLHRELDLGGLARVLVLDTRQYRSDQPCGDGLSNCDERFAEDRTLLGAAQEEWLHTRLRQPGPVWNVLNQQVVMAAFDHNGFPGQDGRAGLFNVDAWDGYTAERGRLMEAFADEAVANPVVLTGDVHASWCNDLKEAFYEDGAATVATEFVGPSVTSPGAPTAAIAQALPDNPHVRFYNGEFHGYLRCTLTPDTWTTDIRAVQTTRLREEPAFTLATFVLEAGKPGASPDGVASPEAPAPDPGPSPDGGGQPGGADAPGSGEGLAATGGGLGVAAGAVLAAGAGLARRQMP